MSAYFVASVTAVTDPDKLKEYGANVPPVTQKYGGKVIAAAPPELVEGQSKSIRLIVVEFPDMDAAKGWYNSDEYKPLAALRISATEGVAFLVEGN
jgi:uncharacterized protein (DUF1330 family)